jgi:hypothetical protein
MKKIIFFVSLLLLTSSALAEDRILGKWKDKNNPIYQFEFKKNQDFIFAHTLGGGSDSITTGVWEIGSWTITDSFGTEEECNLTIYAGELQCCFNYKFIADNLIITCMYSDSSIISTELVFYLCTNRVLIR